MCLSLLKVVTWSSAQVCCIQTVVAFFYGVTGLGALFLEGPHKHRSGTRGYLKWEKQGRSDLDLKQCVYNAPFFFTESAQAEVPTLPTGLFLSFPSQHWQAGPT